MIWKVHLLTYPNTPSYAKHWTAVLLQQANFSKVKISEIFFLSFVFFVLSSFMGVRAHIGHNGREFFLNSQSVRDNVKPKIHLLGIGDMHCRKVKSTKGSKAKEHRDKRWEDHCLEVTAPPIRIAIFQPFLVIFSPTTCSSFTKLRFRRSFWSAYVKSKS